MSSQHAIEHGLAEPAMTLLAPRAIDTEDTPPDPRGLTTAIARYGYSLHDALADLIDNSVDAGARHVLVRFIRDDQAIRRIVIADDGAGMNEEHLRAAMQYGVQVKHARADLGKYGLGLKSASFSQCEAVSVVTRSASGWEGGRRWTKELIDRGWICEKLDPDGCRQLLDTAWGDVLTARSGTLIVWDQVDRLHLGRDRVDEALSRFMKRLPVDLGIVFHRFLANGRLSLALDAVHATTGQLSPARMVEPLDPFGYPRTGRNGYPVSFDVRLDDHSRLALTAHVWPANSKDPHYRLGGGKIAERQGFYFYRNDRVIQAGGWNGWRQNDSEPHTSLARAAIDLPPELDTRFRLDVKKAKLDVPPEFIAGLDSARSGITQLTDWIQAAVDTYRTSDDGIARTAPIVPGRGIPMPLRRAALRLDGTVGPTREIELAWEDLEDDLVFDIDRENDRIVLNRRLRQDILQGAKASGADAPLVKALVFLLLRSELRHQRTSANRRQFLEEVNALLREAVRMQAW
jgi:hypothetical protein